MGLKFDTVKRNFQRFCDNTSCHGFHEMFIAKTLFWKIFWVVICFGAFGVTAYQVINTMDQYINSSTSTVILAAEEQEVMYPPFRLCYWHWLYWVDWVKVNQLRIDEGALLFSFNFYTRIFTSKQYDVDEAEQNLAKYLTENNFTSVFAFHQSIAQTVPIDSDTDDTNFAAYFDKTEVLYKDPGFVFCYTASSDQIFKYFVNYVNQTDNMDKNRIIRFAIANENYENNTNDMSTFITVTEYNQYMLRWISHKTLYRLRDYSLQNLTTFAPPILMYPNAFNEQSNVPIIPDRNEYIINVKASACRWLNTPKAPCVEGGRTVSPNNTCRVMCEAKIYMPNCSCIPYHYAIFMKQDKPHTICRDEFWLLYPTEHVAHSKVPNQTVFTQKCPPKNTKIEDDFKKCLKQCIEPCEVWSYDVSALLAIMPSFLTKIAAKDKTNITLKYSMAKEILIMVETNDKSWESFIGEVGGLLGIWTGASIVSFIQMVYLCCCVDVDKFTSFMEVCNLKKSAQKEVTTTSPIQNVAVVETMSANGTRTKLIFPSSLHLGNQT